MEYSVYELLFFLFCYSFLGWCMETGYMAVRTGKFLNRGFFNLPLCLSYGFTMDLLLLVIPTLEGAYVIQFIAFMVIVSAGAQLADEMSVRVTGKRLWENEAHSIYSGQKLGIVYTLALSTAAFLVLLLIHPVLYVACQMLPNLILRILVLTLLVLLAVDGTVVTYTVRKRPLLPGMQAVSEELKEQKRNFGSWLSGHIWQRLTKAYPNLRPAEPEEDSGYVFAGGLCLDKIIWVFFLSALLGDLIETVYVKLTADIWMSRSSVLYGPFSIVWGVGAALLTILLQRFSRKEDRYIFLGGFFLGGTYEYLCSVFTEVFFGTTFWDYSDMPFNIGGRTNLLFCVFWGILALVWVKICYPPISRQIERIPPVTGKILTWVCVALMACDILISMMAMVRYVERAAGIGAGSRIEAFGDRQYPDEMIEQVWPNLRIQ